MEDTLDNLGRRIDDDATPNLTNSFIHLGLHSYYWGIGTSTLSIKSLHLHLFSSGRHILHIKRGVQQMLLSAIKMKRGFCSGESCDQPNFVYF